MLWCLWLACSVDASHDLQLEQWTASSLEARLQERGFPDARCGQARTLRCTGSNARRGLMIDLRDGQAANRVAEVQLADLEASWRLFRTLQMGDEPLNEINVRRVLEANEAVNIRCTAAKRGEICEFTLSEARTGSVSFLPGIAPRGPADRDHEGVAREEGESRWLAVHIKAEPGQLVQQLLGP